MTWETTNWISTGIIPLETSEKSIATAPRSCAVPPGHPWGPVACWCWASTRQWKGEGPHVANFCWSSCLGCLGLEKTWNKKLLQYLGATWRRSATQWAERILKPVLHAHVISFYGILVFVLITSDCNPSKLCDPDWSQAIGIDQPTATMAWNVTQNSPNHAKWISNEFNKYQ